MGQGKSNKVDKSIPTVDQQIENTKEIGFQSLNNEAVCCTGITGVGTVDVPLKVLPHFSSRFGDMSLPVMGWMTGASQLDGYQNFMGAKGDDSKLQSVGNFMRCGSREPLLGDAQDGKQRQSNNNLVECVVQSDYPEILDGSFLTLGVGVNTEARLKSSHRGFIGKKDQAIKAQLNPSKGQSGYKSSSSPDLNIGVLSDFQAYAGGFSSIEENTIGLSLLKPNFGGLPSIVQNAGKSSNLSTLQNAGESFDVSAFSGAAQNVNSHSFSEYNLGVSGKTSSNLSLSPLQMSPMPQSHVSQSFETPGDQRIGTAFANMDSNQGFYGLSGASPTIGHISSQSGPPYNQSLHGLSDASPNIVHIRNLSRLPTNQSFHGVSGASPIVHSSSQSRLPPNQGFHSFSGVSPTVHTSQSGLPVQVPHQMAPLPSLSSYMTSKYPKVASDQLQECNIGSIPSFQWGSSVASPALWNSKSTSNQYQPDCQGGAGAIQTVENAPFSKRIEDQPFARDGLGASEVSGGVPFSKDLSIQTAEKLSAGDEVAAEGFSNIPSFKNIGVQSASQVIPFARGSAPATTSNLLAGASLKRKEAQPLPITSPVQIKKRRSVKPSIPSSLHKAQDADSVVPLSPVVSQASSVPSLVQSTPSVQPVELTARSHPPLAQIGPAPPLLTKATSAHLPPRWTTPVPPSARMTSPSHIIKWKDSKLPELSGHNCSICKRDLSYRPEGPVFQPAVPPPVAVLSCGHCFHDLCLERITPKDQADNPPCIPCAVSEN